LIESLDILKEVTPHLKNWGLDGAQLSLQSISENIVFKVACRGGNKYVLRVHRPRYHSYLALCSELEWLESLSLAGFKVPKILPTKQAKHYLLINMSGGSRYLSVLDWIEGRSLLETELEGVTGSFLANALAEVGELVSQFHLHAEEWESSKDFSRHRFDEDGFFGKSPFWGRYWDSEYLTSDQRVLLLGSQAVISSKINSLGYSKDVFGLIHGDLHPGNILFDLGKNIRLIDFDDAGFGWYLYDIASLLFEYKDHPEFESLSEGFLRGYRKRRFMSDNDWGMLPLFIHIRGRATIGWASERPELGDKSQILNLVESVCREASSFV
jgi:Ser/Thr protein kinase RdoA (MazF antagonist)